MKKQILIIVLSLFVSLSVFAQIDRFLIGIYSYDYNGNSRAIPGTSRPKGNDIEFLRMLANQNFNYVHVASQVLYTSASENPSKEFLDNAQSLKLKVLLECKELHTFDNDYYSQAYTQQGLDYYANHPAIMGFAMHDEPSQTKFPAINLIASDIRNYNPQLLRWVNLLPVIASDAQITGQNVNTWNSWGNLEYGDPGYKSYVESYINQLNPNVLSFDYYPLWDGTNGLFYNMQIMSELSVQYNIPFVYVLTPIKSPSMPALDSRTETYSIAEYCYMINSALMYGAKGISYWHSGGAYYCWFDVIPPNTMGYLTELHRKLNNNGRLLFNLTFRSAFHYSNQPVHGSNSYEKIPAKSNWSNLSTDTYANQILSGSNPFVSSSGSTLTNLAVSFMTDSYNNNYFWVFNKNLTTGINFTVNMKNSNSRLYDVLNDNLSIASSSQSVYLAPGEAKLFRVVGTIGPSSVCSNVITGTLADDITTLKTFGGAGCSVVFKPDARRNYYSKKIELRNGVKMMEGCRIHFEAYNNIGNATLRQAQSKVESYPSDTSRGRMTKIIVYPKPSTGIVNINVDDATVLVKDVLVYDQVGNTLLWLDNVYKNHLQLDLSDINKGMVLMKVNLDNGLSYTEKLILE